MQMQKFFLFLSGKHTDEDGLEYRNAGRVHGPFTTDSEMEEAISKIARRRNWNGETIVFLRFEGLMTDGPIKLPSPTETISERQERELVSA